MANIGTLTAHVGLDTTALDAQSRHAQATFAGLGSGAAKMAVGIAALGAALGGMMILKDIVTLGADFQQTMETVAGVMRATSEEFDALTASAREMGALTEWTATQAGDALKFLGMAGFEAAKAIAALPGVLDLATAGGLGLGRAADIATNALTAMGLPVEELTRVNDVFIGTITRSNTNMEMMAESFKYAAPVAKAYGYSIEELSGLIGMLGNAGIQGSAAGTQLAMAIVKANDAAAEFGYESSDLIDVLERMNAEGRDTSDIMDVFGIRAGRAALVLRDATDEARAFQETLGGVQGEAKTLADRMRDTVTGSFKELKSVIEDVKLEAFDTFGADLKQLLQNATEWVRENKDTIVAWIDAGVTGFQGLLEVIWSAFGAIESVASAIGGMFDAFSGGVTKSTEELEEFDRKLAETADATERYMLQMANPPDISLWAQFVKQVSALLQSLFAWVQLLADTADDTVRSFTEYFPRAIAAVKKSAEMHPGLGGLDAFFKSLWTSEFYEPPPNFADQLNANLQKALEAQDWGAFFFPAQALYEDWVDQIENQFKSGKAAERLKLLAKDVNVAVAAALLGHQIPLFPPSVLSWKPVSTGAGAGGMGEGGFVGPLEPTAWDLLQESIARARLEARGMGDDLMIVDDQARESLDSIDYAMRGWGHGLADTMATFVQDGADNFKAFAESIIHDILRMAFQWAIFAGMGWGIKETPGSVGFTGGGEAVLEPMGAGMAFPTPMGLGGGGAPQVTVNYHGVRGGEVNVEELSGGAGAPKFEVTVWDAVEAGIARGKFDRILGKSRGGYRKPIGR